MKKRIDDLSIDQDDVIATAAKMAVKKLRDQLEATENARVVLKDTLVAFVQDHIQETLALREHKRRTESIVQAVREFLHNVKARNVAGLDDLACDPSLQQMEAALREAVGCLEVLTVAAELRDADAAIGKQWREDSSLEKWFPFTAEELAKLKARPDKFMAAERRIIAERIYNRLASLPEAGWVHGDTFLPANVLCDYHGQQKLIKLIEETIDQT